MSKENILTVQSAIRGFHVYESIWQPGEADERFGSAALIPVKKIRSKYVHVPTKIRGSDVTIVLPRDRAYNV